ncbi:unnamed protein product [Mortierella alpina]
MFSSSSSSSQPRTAAHSFLDPLDLDLPPPSSTNPITTIHEADEEDDPEYIHIRQHRIPISASSSSAAAYPYSEKQGLAALPIQGDHTTHDHYAHPPMHQYHSSHTTPTPSPHPRAH